MVARSQGELNMSKSTMMLTSNFNFVGKIPHGINTPSVVRNEWDGSRRLTFPLAVVVDLSAGVEMKPWLPDTFGYSGSRFCSHFPLFGHNKWSPEPLENDLLRWCVLYMFCIQDMKMDHLHSQFRSLTSNPSHPAQLCLPSVSCRPSKSDWREKCAPGVIFQMSSLLLL